ncbi:MULTISPECIES: outer membrane protein [unclassified Bartonella]|uniref:outer membrane protein n=1 Tax=unclassified Bartonella TaxID=2645622 RepID=UPI002361C11D|nr:MULTISPECIES: outer membrane protein [unclassified Bartonella]
MKKKHLISISLAALMATSTVQAADTVTLPEIKSNIIKSNVPAVIVAPAYSWTGLYVGGQFGGFSSKSVLNYSEDATTGKWSWIDKKLSPKPSEFMGGGYLGSNIDLGNNFVLGVDTDFMWSGKKDTRTGEERKILDDDELDSINEVFEEANIRIVKPAAQDETIPNIGDLVVSSVTLKEKWAGATRVRIGFASDRVMPYVSGGIAYAQMQYILSLLSKSQEDAFVFASGNVLDETKTMIGYTVGGGLDFALTNNIILRTEYRYSDFGKKKFGEDKLEIGYNTNDFRIGVAYKF